MADRKPREDDVDPIEKAFVEAKTNRVTTYDVAWIIAAAARMPSIMMMAKPRITRRMFDASEASLLLLWKSVSAAAEANGGVLPEDPQVAIQFVERCCQEELQNDPHGLYYTSSVVRQVTDDEAGLIREIVRFKVTPEVEREAVRLLARFLTERMWADPVCRAMAGIGPGSTVSDPAAVINLIEQRARELVGLSDDPGGDAIEAGFVPTGRKSVTTKLKFLDSLMNGGHADGEAYAIIGPSSGGKSVILSQIALEAAQLEAAIASELGQPEARFWYYFTWELTRAQLQTRMYSYAAKIDINSFNELTNNNVPLSTSANIETLKEYEKVDPYVNSPGNPVLGELERMRALEKRFADIGNNLKIVDYSGDKPGHGDGGLPEVVAYLRTEVTKGRRIGGIVIDYAGLTVNRYLNAKNIDPKSQYGYLAGFGNQVRSQIAIPFRCKVWVAHQLHGDAAKKKFGKLHSSDALGCRNFADNFDFGIEFAKYDSNTGLVQFSSSKHRHAAAVDSGPIAKFDGRFNVFVDPSEEHVRDPSTGQIVPRSFLDQMPVGVGPMRTGPAPFNPWDGVD